MPRKSWASVALLESFIRICKATSKTCFTPDAQQQKGKKRGGKVSGPCSTEKQKLECDIEKLRLLDSRCYWWSSGKSRFSCLHHLRAPSADEQKREKFSIAVANHFAKHLQSSENTCRWKNCNRDFSAQNQLRRHLREDHDLQFNFDKNYRKTCILCDGRPTFLDQIQWENHRKAHLM